jgi:hypothetical protein
MTNTDPAETWLRHHWRFEKSSNIATVLNSLLKHSPTAFWAVLKTASDDKRSSYFMSWIAETFACIYSRVYVPAVLENYGKPTYRAAYNTYIGGCHENN